MSIEIIDSKLRISPTELIELGKLLLAKIRKDNSNRKVIEVKKSASSNLVFALLISIPTNKESPMDDKLWDKGIIIAHNNPLEFKLITE